jgi:hypothetical protein
MTTFMTGHGSRTSAPAILRPGLQRFGRSLASVGALVLDAVEATRAIQSAHSNVDRRAVLDRFAADTTRDASRSAA